MYAFQRIQHFELSGIAISGTFCGDRCNVLIGHIYNTDPFRHIVRIGKRDFHIIVAHPCFRPEREYLLLILLPIYHYQIGCIPIRRAGNFRRQCFVPCGPSGVNVLCRSQHLLRPCQFNPAQIGIDLQVVDVPITDEITPQRHLGGVIAQIFIFEPKFLQAPGRVSVGHNSKHLRIACLLVRQVLDAFSDLNSLWYTILIRVYTVRWNFADLTTSIIKIIIGVDLGLYLAVDGQVGHLRAAIIYINFTKRFINAGGGGGGREESQCHN